jgi:hypothetical protein
MKRLWAWVLTACLLAGCLLGVASGASGAGAVPLQTPVEARRGAEQTLLTYPEWFLVFSPYEYGEYLAQGAPPSAFPFYGHIRQFWQGYERVALESQARKLEPNPGYHLMIMVIGVSTTVEYALKSAYESLIGRLTEVRSPRGAPERSAEEIYAASVAQDYVRFIRVRPWYEYDFGSKLAGLWHGTALWGEHPVRSLERKFALSTEYLVKMVYAQLIGLGTAGVYDPALPTTTVLLREAPQPDASLSDMQLLQPQGRGGALVSLPRYEAFTHYAQALADQGNGFVEIAGNTSFILVSVLTHEPLPLPQDSRELFTQPILTMPGLSRHVLVLPVPQLAESLRAWKQAGLTVEHIFDY